MGILAGLLIGQGSHQPLDVSGRDQVAGRPPDEAGMGEDASMNPALHSVAVDIEDDGRLPCVIAGSIQTSKHSDGVDRGEFLAWHARSISAAVYQMLGQCVTMPGMLELTSARRRVLVALGDRQWHRLRPVMAAVGHSSQNTTWYVLERLVKHGLVEQIPQAGWRLSPRVVVSEEGRIYRVVWTLPRHRDEG